MDQRYRIGGRSPIDQFRGLLNQDGRGHSMLVDHLRRSLEEQNDPFKSFVESIRSRFDEGY